MLHSINNNISQHLNEIGVRFDEPERRISVVEDTAVETEKQVASLKKSVRGLTERLQDQENHGRWKNLRTLGLCEKAEGNDAVKFMEQCIPRILDIETKADEIMPRAMIVRFHSFSYHQRVMEAAQHKKEVLFEGIKQRRWNGDGNSWLLKGSCRISPGLTTPCCTQLHSRSWWMTTRKHCTLRTKCLHIFILWNYHRCVHCGECLFACCPNNVNVHLSSLGVMDINVITLNLCRKELDVLSH